jgi:VanZ family protein
MASRRHGDFVDMLESPAMAWVTVAMYVIALALFAGVALHPQNTLALVDPIIRWFRPFASFDDIDHIHRMAREFGHFLIPAMAFVVLVIGPLRKRPLFALLLCAAFAVIDESLQNFMPGRTGSLADVIVDVSGATLAYVVYRTILLIQPRRRHRTLQPRSGRL